jgi:hypothetical protein
VDSRGVDGCASRPRSPTRVPSLAGVSTRVRERGRCNPCRGTSSTGAPAGSSSLHTSGRTWPGRTRHTRRGNAAGSCSVNCVGTKAARCDRAALARVARWSRRGWRAQRSESTPRVGAAGGSSLQPYVAPAFDAAAWAVRSDTGWNTRCRSKSGPPRCGAPSRRTMAGDHNVAGAAQS